MAKPAESVFVPRAEKKAKKNFEKWQIILPLTLAKRLVATYIIGSLAIPPSENGQTAGKEKGHETNRVERQHQREERRR